MLELKLKPASGNYPANGAYSANTLENRQPRNKMLALTLLLVTFAVLIAKDHDFWFGDDESTDDVVAADTTPVNATSAAPVARHAAPAAVAAPKKQVKIQTGTLAAAAQPEKTAQPAGSAIAASNRAAITPLGIEVVSGDKHSKPHASNSSTKLEITSTAAPATNAAERVPMSTSISSTNIPATSTTIQATATPDSYPLLSQQMKVQGSVVLQAIIGADGNIQDLRVIAGPAILTSAAQQAVRQWRFKPYMQNGQAVETKARITVNFTINVGDNSPKIS
jgi:TonB family protein